MQSCGGTTGGVSDAAIFDPSDFNFTQAAAVSGVAQPYTAIALRAGATAVGGAKVFLINFQQDEAEYTWKQSVKGCSVKYEHQLTLQLNNNSQDLTTFLQSLDAAGCCCGLGVIIRLNSGKIFVMGEKYVGGSAIPRFTIKQDGSDGTSGKLFDDANVGNLILKGSYTRPLYEYTGTWASIEALM